MPKAPRQPKSAAALARLRALMVAQAPDTLQALEHVTAGVFGTYNDANDADVCVYDFDTGTFDPVAVFRLAVNNPELTLLEVRAMGMLAAHELHDAESDAESDAKSDAKSDAPAAFMSGHKDAVAAVAAYMAALDRCLTRMGRGILQRRGDHVVTLQDVEDDIMDTSDTSGWGGGGGGDVKNTRNARLRRAHVLLSAEAMCRLHGHRRLLRGETTRLVSLLDLIEARLTDPVPLISPPPNLLNVLSPVKFF